MPAAGEHYWLLFLVQIYWEDTERHLKWIFWHFPFSDILWFFTNILCILYLTSVRLCGLWTFCQGFSLFWINSQFVSFIQDWRLIIPSDPLRSSDHALNSFGSLPIFLYYNTILALTPKCLLLFSYCSLDCCYDPFILDQSILKMSFLEYSKCFISSFITLLHLLFHQVSFLGCLDPVLSSASTREKGGVGWGMVELGGPEQTEDRKWTMKV